MAADNAERPHLPHGGGSGGEGGAGRPARYKYGRDLASFLLTAGAMLGVAQCGSEVRKWRRGPGEIACANPVAPQPPSGAGPRNLDIAREATEVRRRVVSLCRLRGRGVRRSGGGLGFPGSVQVGALRGA